MVSKTQKILNNLIDLYFNEPNSLVKHLIDSDKQFVSEIIPYLLIVEKNVFIENIDNENIYIHGFKFSNIRIKPPTFENDNEIKFPSDARKKQLNYFSNLIVDIQQYLEKINAITGETIFKPIGDIEKDIPIANIPIMVKSDYCSTNIKKDLHGECKYDPGGYFIVNGAEKIIMSIEKMVDNKILIFSKKDSSYINGLIYIAQINSKKNDWSDNLQILTIKNKKDNVLAISTSSQLVDIPIFILMRAFGIESDKDILSYLTFDLNDTKMINLLRPSMIASIDESGTVIKTKEEAIEYLLSRLKKNKRITQSNEMIANIQKKMLLEKILRQDLLPHLGEDIPKKILFISYMVNKLLNVILGRRELDDRDALQNKRIDTPGVLLGQLLRQNWKKMLNDIGKHFKKKNQSDENPINVIGQIKYSSIEQGIKTALSTGFWGLNRNKSGVAQSLQRLAWLQSFSYKRRIMAPSMEESTSKVTSIRNVNNNQMNLLCCLTGDTEILLENKMDIKLIKDIIDSDIVNTINPTNLTEQKSSIYNKFSKQYDKLFEIKTISGRIIKATDDHKLLILDCENKIIWKKVNELTLTDKLLIRYVHKYLPNDSIDSNLILDINYKDQLYILARLYGYYYSFNNLNNNENKNTIIFKNNNINDILYIQQDINKLKFPYYNFEFINDSYNLNIDDTNFLKFFEVFELTKNIIPNWIINGTKLIKREFLAGFYGYSLEHNYDNNYILDLLKDFNIIKNTININFELETIDNIINFGDFIGLRYNENNYKELGKLSEYYKIIKNISNYQKYHNICSYNEFIKDNCINDILTIKIHSINPIDEEIVYDFTTYSNNHSFIANSIISSNCIETPEGAKIGIVKSLAMMASISLQNSSQYDIIKNILNQYDFVKHPYDIDPLSMKEWVKIFLNGDWFAVIKISESFNIYNILKNHKRNNIIDRLTSILFDFNNKEIRIYFDGGRLYRPLLIVENNKLNLTDEIIEDINNEMKLSSKSKSWKKIISKYPNIIEYEDIESLNFALVCDTEKKLNNKVINSDINIDSNQINRYNENLWVNYTHCDFHAWVMLGSIVANIPFGNHNNPGRNTIHFCQAKQSIGIYLSSYKDRIDISQILWHPHIPLVITQGWKYNGCKDLAYGEPLIVAICSYNGYNEEDSIIFNQSSIDRGTLRTDSIRKYHSEILKNPSTSQDDMFVKPDRNKVTGMKQGNYDKLNEKGFLEEETIVNNEDIIIGKISPIQPTGNNNKVYKDSSEIYKSNVQGVIDKIHNNIYSSDGYEMHNLKIRMERKPMIGDKFTDFYGSKGTIGITYPQCDMPFTESGIIPDLILNPLGYPGRMATGKFLEMLASKEAAENCHFVDGTPFNDYDINQTINELKKLGYSPYGTEAMYCGKTGRKMDTEIFIGPSYEIRLKHLVLDKVHGRARGPKHALTRQPLEGRSKEGGLKIGEMEKDAMVAHGISQFIKERMMETSDICKVYVCDECGMFAAKVIDKDYYRCKACHNTNKISAVVIPYALKLLFHELTSVNILPRIRTEKSIYANDTT